MCSMTILTSSHSAGLPLHRHVLAVDVCLCTFRRPQVAETLASLARQDLPPGVRMRVIVADNDDHPTARDVVARAAIVHDLSITYLHAPARNISVARNACLDAVRADWLAFIDDDERAAPDWLTQLLTCATAEGADAVFGPSVAIYPPDTPRWISRNDFLSNHPVRRGGKVETGHSCNVLIRRDAIPEGLRFRPDLGQSGGEDTDFFYQLGRSGAHMTICDTAEVTEPAAPHRLRAGWLAERRMAEGRHYATSSGRGRVALATSALAKAALCLAVALPLALHQPTAARWALRGVFHLGVAAGAIAPHHRRRAYGVT
ncbi:MAG: glycosyltransferase [Rhodobacteraceae bacterium PARR1]|nr:MAG: glycosyltransferase [Rhodobacteraceae bacterium PARR1]